MCCLSSSTLQQAHVFYFVPRILYKTAPTSCKTSYADVKINGAKAMYVAPSVAGESHTYSNKIEDLQKGVEKEVKIEITDTSCTNSPFIKTIKVKWEEANNNTIAIKGYFLDNKLVSKPSEVQKLDKDNCTLKITCERSYADVKINGDMATYTAPSTAGEYHAYSKEIRDLQKGVEKEVKIEITDASCTNSPFTKTIKVKWEEDSSYTPIEITHIYVGDERYSTLSIPANIEMKNGTALTLTAMYKKIVATGKEKVRFTVDGNNSQEIAVTGRRADATFASITSGTHTVKVEQLVGSDFSTVHKTFNFQVEYKAVQEKIEVLNIRMSSEHGRDEVMFKQGGGLGSQAKPLSGLELADENNLYEYKIENGSKFQVTIEVRTDGCQIEYKIGDNGTHTLTSGTMKEVEIQDGTHNAEIKVSKSGFKTRTFKFKVKKAALVVENITIDDKSYTWDAFHALTESIKINKEKITIKATWKNTESVIATLQKDNVLVTLKSNENKEAIWENVPILPGTNNFRIRLEITGLPWKNKIFKIERASTAQSETRIAEVKVFAYHRATIASPQVEWPFAKIGMSEFDLYLKPKDANIQGIKLKKPVESNMQKVTSGKADGFYRASTFLSSGDKIIFEVTAQDGTKREYGFSNQKKVLENGGPAITLAPFVFRDLLHYSDDKNLFPSKNKASFDKNTFVATVPVQPTDNVIYLKVQVLKADGIQDLEEREGYTIEGKTVKDALTDIYILKCDVSNLQTQGEKTLEIHFKFKTSTNGITDCFQHAAYKVNLKKK